MSSVFNKSLPLRLLGVAALIAIALALICVSSPVAAKAPDAPDTTDAAESSGSHPVAMAIRITGNQHFNERQLREAAAEDLISFERRGHRRAEADDSAYSMELAYRKAGFHFARVSFQIITEGKELRLLFQVVEGARIMVSDLVFHGNQIVDSERLKAFFRPIRPGQSQELYYVEEDVRSVLGAIREFYLDQGFVDARISARPPKFAKDGPNVLLEFDVEEGSAYVIRAIDFTGEVATEAEEPLRLVAEELIGKPFHVRRGQLLVQRIREALGNLGYPEPQVEINESRDPASGNVRLEAVISSGQLTVIDDIAISGNQKTKTSFIEKRLALERGDLYLLSKKIESFKSLYHTGLFSRIDIDLQPQDPEGKNVLEITVVESKSREFSLEGGWGSYELLRFGMGFRDKNLFGTGRIIRAESGLSAKGEKILVGITDPWLLGSGISADLPFSYTRREEPSFTRQETALSLFLSKDLGHDIAATLGYSYQLNQIMDADAAISREDPESNYALATLKGQLTLDTRDDIFFPISGYRFFIAADLSDEVLGSEISLVRLTGGGRIFHPLPYGFILGLRYHTGLVIPGRDQVTIPVGERFYNGGENKVRSFRESRLGPIGLDHQPVGGMAYNLATLEFRRRIGRNFSASLFADLGNVSPNRSRAEEGEASFSNRSHLINTTLDEYFSDFRTALGIGGQYLLPVGPIRLDIALNPDYRPERGEDRYVIHFSIGMAF